MRRFNFKRQHLILMRKQSWMPDTTGAPHYVKKQGQQNLIFSFQVFMVDINAVVISAKASSKRRLS